MGDLRQIALDRGSSDSGAYGSSSPTPAPSKNSPQPAAPAAPAAPTPKPGEPGGEGGPSAGAGQQIEGMKPGQYFEDIGKRRRQAAAGTGSVRRQSLLGGNA